MLASSRRETYLRGMLRDDVILRQIRQLVEALLRAAHLRREKDTPAAEETVDDIIEDASGLSLELLRAVTPATLLDLLSPAGVLPPSRALAIGLALAEKASLREAEREPWRSHARALLEAAGVPEVERALDDELVRRALLTSLEDG